MSDPVATGPGQPAAHGAADPQRSRLVWRCRRGMKELDLLLLAWLESAYDSAGADERACFAALLELPDPQLVRYLTMKERPADAALAGLVATIAGIMSARRAGTLAPPASPTGVVLSAAGCSRQRP
ncbi:MAG: succinate dehydrogenase assembly factor 2 [Steroidobacteraceae bacterium]